MNKGELIGKLQMVYVGDKNALNELIGYYDGLKQGIEELQQENQELKLEKEKLLKSMLKAHLDLKKDGEYSEFKAGAIAMLTSIMEEIKEIEKGDEISEIL